MYLESWSSSYIFQFIQLHNNEKGGILSLDNVANIKKKSIVLSDNSNTF